MINKYKLMKAYSEETGKNALWRGKLTKGFKKWKREIIKQKKDNCIWCGEKVNLKVHDCPKKAW